MLDSEHVEALSMLLFRPSRYTQRVVERLSFLPLGGERWRRDIQIRIPTIDSPADDVPPGGQCVVSLGMFRRCRFPDFAVHDASGERLSLVTRRQHQHCITLAAIRQYLNDDDWARAATEAEEELRELYTRMADLVTDIKGETAREPSEIEQSARNLMAKLSKDETTTKRVASMLASDCEPLARYTHYLCWVPAGWGKTVSLSATYTMSDSVRLAGAPRKRPAAKTSGSTVSRLLGARVRGYARFNLCPVPYELRAPAHDHAGSYYLTIEPPADAHVSLLDWGSDRAFAGATAEIDCAYATCHIHNGERLIDDQGSPQERQSVAGSRISAFLKADAVDNAALIAIAILNIGLAFLAQKGAFVPRGEIAQQQWLLLAPVLLIALIGQHRRRYYSPVTRLVRLALWGYLAATVLFGASVAFDVLGGDVLDDLASAVMACGSLGLAGLVAASGTLHERVTGWLFRRRADGARRHRRRRASYLRTARAYADAAIAVVGVAVLVLIGAMLKFGWGDGRQEALAEAQGRSVEAVDGGVGARRHGARPKAGVARPMDGGVASVSD